VAANPISKNLREFSEVDTKSSPPLDDPDVSPNVLELPAAGWAAGWVDGSTGL
jgi:hypothetical protein